MRTEDGFFISKCLNGETETFGFLVDKYRESVFAFAYSKLCNFDDAEDVTQEVFLKAYKDLRNLKRWDSFATWLYSITNNICKNYLRSQSRRLDKKLIANQDTIPSEPTLSDSENDDPMLDPLSEALKILPEIYRQVLTLYYLGGKNSEEIASFLGISPATVRQRLSRARSELKEEMLDMMSKAVEQKKLPVGFTFNVLEMVKRIGINPTPSIKTIPWGISLAMGLLMAVLGVHTNLNSFGTLGFSYGISFLGDMKALKIGEMPVKTLKISEQQAFFNQSGEDKAAGDRFPSQPAIQLGKGSLNRMAYSPDGKLLAIAGSLGIWLYDASNMQQIGLLGHTDRVNCVAFSPDSKTIISGSRDRTIRIWDVAEQKQIGVLEGHKDYLYRIAFSPDGRTIASSSARTVDSEPQIRLWDVKELKQIGLLEGHTAYVMCLIFSPDGKTLISGSYDQTVRLWDVDTQKQTLAIKNKGWPVYTMALSPDGKTLAWSDVLSKVSFLDMETKKQTWGFEGFGNYAVAFSPDGNFFATSAIDNTIHIWDFKEQREVAVLNGFNIGGWGEDYIAFSNDGKTLAAYCKSGVLFWDIDKPGPPKRLEDFVYGIYSISFCPDGKTLAIAGGSSISLWDIYEQKLMSVSSTGLTSIYSISVNFDGKMIAGAGSGGNAVMLWNMDKQRLSQQPSALTGGDLIYCVAFSKKDNTLFFSNGNTVTIFDVDKRKKIVDLPPAQNHVFDIVLSQDEKILAGINYDSANFGNDGAVDFWDIQKQEKIGTIQMNRSYYLAISPDGKTLATGGPDYKVYLWDIDKGKQIKALEGHTSPPYMTFSPKGEILASASSDGVRLWDMNTKEQVAKFDVPIGHLKFSPDGEWLAGGGWDSTILLWKVDVLNPFSIEAKGKLPITWGKAKRTELYQNYPNPFNPETWIPYQLSESADVSISIYTESGKLVRKLILGHKEVGSYLDRSRAGYWDGKDESGEFVSSGVYFYKLEAGSYRETKKMILMR